MPPVPKPEPRVKGAPRVKRMDQSGLADPKPEPKRKRRGRIDRVLPPLHERVLRRDECCIGYRFNRQHICRSAFSISHSAYDLRMLQVDHFWLISGGVRADRAPSDEWHLAAMCAGLNAAVPREIREFERSYIAGLPGFPVDLPDREREMFGERPLSSV